MNRFAKFLLLIIPVVFIVNLWIIYVVSTKSATIFIVTTIIYTPIWVIYLRSYFRQRDGIVEKLLFAMIITPILAYSAFRIFYNANYQALEMITLLSSSGVFWALAIKTIEGLFQ